MTALLLDRNAQTIPCDRCGVMDGDVCRDVDGWPCDTHDERVKAAERVPF